MRHRLLEDQGDVEAPDGVAGGVHQMCHPSRRCLSRNRGYRQRRAQNRASCSTGAAGVGGASGSRLRLCGVWYPTIAAVYAKHLARHAAVRGH